MLMSKRIYVGTYAASFSLCLLAFSIWEICLIFGLEQKNGASDAPLIDASGIGIYAYLQFVVVHTVYNFWLLARMWNAIQDGQTKITVGRAIGFLFIPVFNIYWIFRAWGSFPTEYNQYVDRYGLPVPLLAGKVFVAYPILLLLAGILYVPLLALPFVFIAVISNACGAINLLDQAVRDRRSRTVSETPTEAAL